MSKTDPLSAIYNYRRISETLATAGQPTAEQIHQIADEGFEVVINLGLQDADYALQEEGNLVRSAGLAYEHIPVLWDHPLQENFQQFVEVVDCYRDQKQFIHCAANMRVSVFTTLYQIYKGNVSENEALEALCKFWTPNEIWHSYIQEVLESFQQ